MVGPAAIHDVEFAGHQHPAGGGIILRRDIDVPLAKARAAVIELVPGTDRGLGNVAAAAFHRIGNVFEAIAISRVRAIVMHGDRVSDQLPRVSLPGHNFVTLGAVAQDNAAAIGTELPGERRAIIDQHDNPTLVLRRRLAQPIGTGRHADSHDSVGRTAVARGVKGGEVVANAIGRRSEIENVDLIRGAAGKRARDRHALAPHSQFRRVIRGVIDVPRVAGRRISLFSVCRCDGKSGRPSKKVSTVCCHEPGSRCDDTCSSISPKDVNYLGRMPDQFKWPDIRGAATWRLIREEW